MNKYTPTQIEQIKEVGNYLYQKRLEQSITLEQLAAMTFIRLSLLKYLEQGQVDELPELVYVQGFIRRYGEALELDGHALAHKILPDEEAIAPEISPELVAAPPMEEGTNTQAPPPIISSGTKTSPGKSAKTERVSSTHEMTDKSGIALFQGLKLYWIYLVLLSSAIGGLFYLFTRPPASKTTAENQPTQKVETVSPPATSNQNLTEPNPVANTPQETPESVPSPVATPLVETTPFVSPSPQEIPLAQESPSPTPTVQNGPVSASVQLENDSWIRVQSDGTTKYEGILEKGTQETWTAQETLIIRAGNAGAVNLSVNNKPAQPFGNLGEVKEITVTGSTEQAE